jgi:hypothetical protein
LARQGGNQLKGDIKMAKEVIELNTSRKKTINEKSIETQTLIKRLSEMKRGEEVSYKELSDLIGADVQTVAYCYCKTARERCLKDFGLVFEPVVNTGLKCMTEEEVALSGQFGIQKIRRVAKREKSKLHHGIENFDGLTNEAKIAHNTAASIYGVFELVSKPKEILKIEAQITNKIDMIPAKKALDLFK